MDEKNFSVEMRAMTEKKIEVNISEYVKVIIDSDHDVTIIDEFLGERTISILPKVEADFPSRSLLLLQD